MSPLKIVFLVWLAQIITVRLARQPAPTGWKRALDYLAFPIAAIGFFIAAKIFD